MVTTTVRDSILSKLASRCSLCGYRNVEIETAVIRWNYDDPSLGACKETIQGGNHFRYWVQDGKSANRYVVKLLFEDSTLIRLHSGAVFMALSYEKPIARTLYFKPCQKKNC